MRNFAHWTPAKGRCGDLFSRSCESLIKNLEKTEGVSGIAGTELGDLKSFLVGGVGVEMAMCVASVTGCPLSQSALKETWSIAHSKLDVQSRRFLFAVNSRKLSAQPTTGGEETATTTVAVEFDVRYEDMVWALLSDNQVRCNRQPRTEVSYNVVSGGHHRLGPDRAPDMGAGGLPRCPPLAHFHRETSPTR